ncbi:MAG: oligosaccharide flippase family protein [Gammaproteobacteria bacterium]|nr:oligosaccharide flippase family protein [Gammaproteobacteria bacterium]
MQVSDNSVAKHLFYVAMMVTGMALSFGKWILFAKFLLPADFGAYSAVMASIVIGTYIGAVGLNEHLIQEGSRSHGLGQIAEVHKLRDRSIAVGLLMAGLLTVPTLTVSYMNNWWNLKATDFILVCALLVSTVVFVIVDSSLRAEQRALPFAGMLFLRAVLLIVSGYALVPYLGISGIFLAELASSVVAILVSLWMWGPSPRLKALGLSLAVIISLIKRGFSFLKLQLLRYASLVFDKWLVGWFIGMQALGQYSFLLITFLAFVAFAGVYNAVIIPRLISRYSKSNNLNALVKANRIQVGVFIIGSLILMPIYLWAASELIARHFSEYAFPHFFISLVFIYAGSMFHVATQFFDSMFYALQKQIELTFIATLSLLLFGLYYFVAGELLTPSVLWFSLAFMLTKVSWFLMTVVWFMKIKSSSVIIVC